MKKFGAYTKWVVAFIFAVAVIAVYKTFDNFSFVLNGFSIFMSAIKPFIVAFFIAYVLNLPIKKMNLGFLKSRFKFMRAHSLGISIILSYIGALLIITLIVGAVIPALYKNLYDFYLNLDGYEERANAFLGQFEIFQRFNLFSGSSDFNLVEMITRLLVKIDTNQVEKYIQGFFSATSQIISVFISIIISIYMIIDKDMIIEYCKKILNLFCKKHKVDHFLEEIEKINSIFTKYIYSRLVCCVVMGIVCSVVLSILRVKYAFVLGMFIGICDLIPYFGSIIATVIAIIVNMLSSGILSSLVVGVVLLILQQIDGNVLSPKIMGESLKLRPLLIIFAVIVGGGLFSVLGMLLSVPVVAVIKAMMDEFVENKELKNSGEENNVS